MYLEQRAVRLQLWDTAGQERFRSLIPSYIRDSSVAIVVYDITNRASFLNVSRWVEYVRAERGDEICIVLVGNKSDLGGDRRQVSVDEGEDRAKAEHIRFFETSARAGINIKSMLRTTVSDALTSSLSRLPDRSSSSDGLHTTTTTTPPSSNGFSSATDTITLTHANTSFQNQQRREGETDATCQC